LVLGLINDWNGVCSILEEGEKSVDVKWYMIRMKEEKQSIITLGKDIYHRPWPVYTL